MRMKYLLIWILLASFFIPQVLAMPWDSPQTLTWYMRADTHTINNRLGYVLNSTQTSTQRQVNLSLASEEQVWWSARVYVRSTDNASVELTSAYNTNVTRTVNGEGLQNVTFTPSATPVYYAADAIQLNLYIKVGSPAWILRAIFISSQLRTDEILNSTWIFRFYTYRNWTGAATIGRFNWGDSSHGSLIENVELATLAPWEEQIYHLTKQDFISFIVTPWTYFIGNIFYGLLLLFFVMTTYNKYEDVRPVIAWFWIFGGTGGFLTIMIPTIGLHLSWFFLAFALGTTLFLLFK